MSEIEFSTKPAEAGAQAMYVMMQNGTLDDMARLIQSQGNQILTASRKPVRKAVPTRNKEGVITSIAHVEDVPFHDAVMTLCGMTIALASNTAQLSKTVHELAKAYQSLTGKNASTETA